MAELADKHQLYQQAVQKPRKEVRNLDTIYRKLCTQHLDHATKKLSANQSPGESSDSGLDDPLHGHRRHALTMREDFCGTAVLCAEWVRTNSSPERCAYGVDIDKNVIDYAMEHTVGGVGHYESSLGSRIKLVCADVMAVKGSESASEELHRVSLPRVDIIASLNYAMCYFHQRQDLIRYLKHSLKNLNDFGLLFCDIFGGVEATKSGISNIRDLGSFKYYFHQHSYDLMNNTIRFSLGFKMRDGSVLKNCFSYEFRVYTVSDLKEAMLEAGFDDVSVWISPRTRDGDEESDEDKNSDSSEESDGEASSCEDEGKDASDDSHGHSNSGQGDFEAFTEMKTRMEMPYA
ncbi:hypothetical protein EC988_007976, partial [Linderina pennispora]